MALERVRSRSRRTPWRRTRRGDHQGGGRGGGRPHRGRVEVGARHPPALGRAEGRDGHGGLRRPGRVAESVRGEPLAWTVAPLRCWVRWPGPAQRPLVNRVRVGRQQLSAGMAGCRSQPGRRTEHRAGWSSERMGRLGRHGRRPLRLALSPLPAGAIRRDQGPGPRRPGAAQRRARRPGVARLPLQRAPRHGQDVLGAHPGQGAQLRGARRR